jgi:lipoprotein-releasing system permease protein
MQKEFFLWLPRWAWTLAFRHLRSRHSRPGIRWINRFAFVGVIVGVFAWTSLMSLMSGLQNQTRKRILLEKPHWAWEGSPVSGLSEKIESLKQDPKRWVELGFESILPVLVTEGLVELPRRGEKGRALGSGVVIEGRPEIPSGEVLLGSELSAFLSPNPDELLRFYSAWDLKIPPFEFTSNQTFSSGIYEIDRTSLQVSLKDLQDWLGLGEVYSKILVRVKNPEELTTQQKDTLEKHFGLIFKSWKERDSALWYSLKLEKVMMSLVLFFVIAIAMVALNISMAVRVNEKSREMAVMRSFGVQEKWLVRIFVTEGAVMGLLGGFLGLGLARVFCELISKYLKMPDIYYSTSIPFEWDWAVNLGFVGVSFLFCAWVSYLPSRRLRGFEVASILRS